MKNATSQTPMTPTESATNHAPECSIKDTGHCVPCKKRQRIWRGVAVLVILAFAIALSTLMAGRAQAQNERAVALLSAEKTALRASRDTQREHRPKA